LTVIKALVSLLPAALVALQVYFPQSDNWTVGTLILHVLSMRLNSKLGQPLISWPLWNQVVVKGAEPATLHSISPGRPATRLMSLSFRMNVAGIILSVIQKYFAFKYVLAHHQDGIILDDN
jgi:hypothetical protein